MAKNITNLPRWKRLALISTCAVVGLAVHVPGQATVIAAPLSLAALGLLDTNCDQASTFAPAAIGIPSATTQATKSAAILGGTMSALDRIRAQQAGIQVAQPALTGASAAQTQVANTADTTHCAALALAMPTANLPVVAPSIAPEPASDSFLATHRVAIRRTSFSRNWDRVSADGLSRDRVTVLIGAREADGATQIQFVNRWVNQAISYGEDRTVWGRRDYWATADETLALRRGDCEDLAILKYQMLLALGVDPQDMYLTLARDLARNADHAILIVRHDSRYFLLDNSTDAILPANLSYDYRPTLSFNSQSAWLHSAVVRSRPQFASIDDGAPPLLSLAISSPIFRPVRADIALLDYRPVVSSSVNWVQFADIVGQGRQQPVRSELVALDQLPSPVSLAIRPALAAIPVADYLSVRARSSPRVIGLSR